MSLLRLIRQVLSETLGRSEHGINRSRIIPALNVTLAQTRVTGAVYVIESGVATGAEGLPIATP
jgi:hypothetical protein